MITKSSIVLITILLAATKLHAQQPADSTMANPGLGWLSVTLGVGIPMGDYSAHSSAGVEAGYAKPGFAYRADIFIPLYKVMGATVAVTGGNNRVNTDEFKRSFNSGGEMAVKETGWEWYGVLGGFYYRLPNPSIPFYLKAQTGVTFITSPELLLTSNTSAGSIKIRQDPKSSWALTFDLGAGVLVPLSRNVSVCVAADYIFYRAKFDHVNVTTTSLPASLVPNETIQGSFTQPVHILAITLGLAFPIY